MGRPGEVECADIEGDLRSRADPDEREGERMGVGGVEAAESVRKALGGAWYPGLGPRAPKVTRVDGFSLSLAERDGRRRRMLLVLWRVGAWVASGLGLRAGPRLRQNLRLGEVASSGDSISVPRFVSADGGVGRGDTTVGRTASAEPLERLRRRLSDALCWIVWRMAMATRRHGGEDKTRCK